jgi:HD-GYP domain-containing protein (c-di-GMP phosphodiesterase class II)
MSQDLCEMSLQQTQELLRLTDETLQNICCKKFTSEELYAEAIQKVLGGRGKRGPSNIFIVFREKDGAVRRGRLFHLKEGELVETSDEISIDTMCRYEMNLAMVDVIASNWADSCANLEEYQSYFQPDLRDKVNGAIRNFATCRISGETPGLIIAFNYPGKATIYDGDVLRSLAVLIGSLVTISDELKETEKAFIYTIEALARACEASEEHTGKHILRVNRYAGALAANMGLPGDFIDVISYSAQMHDVGKIKIPNSILLKEGPLNREEIDLMMMHPVYGEQILGDSPRLQTAREIALAHHENWDGSGYPNRLAGERIPVAGRIVKIADVYDALRSRRSYKQPISHVDAIKVFREGDDRINPGAHFDPVMLRTFFQIEHIFANIYDSSEETAPEER